MGLLALGYIESELPILPLPDYPSYYKPQAKLREL